MSKYFLIIVLLFLAISLGAMYFFIGASPIYREIITIPSKPHLFAKHGHSIAHIHITALYFVPKDKTTRVYPSWQHVLETNIQKLVNFHSLQFRAKSSITYSIIPKPIFGAEHHIFYDTEITQHGNPEGLRRISAELDNRLFTSGGDYTHLFKKPNGDHNITLIMYEGVGASGSDTNALVSRIFLTDPAYTSLAATFLAHEFYHTLGIPDHYTVSEKVFPDGTNVPIEILTSQDIMGLVENPIEKTYLEHDTLKQMGI